MKKVLVIYFTQTGQLNQALRATLAPLAGCKEVSIHYEQVKPEKAYPYPWSYMQFFDVFPETVHGTPCLLKPFSNAVYENYDLVIIGYQPWYLSVCIPINSFLQTEAAKKLLFNKPVITVIACRNMWLTAQEKIKVRLNQLQANLVGNVTYVDKSANLISLITVLAFVLKGVQDKFLGIFPKYGVSENELKMKAPQFGTIILMHLLAGNYTSLQAQLVEANAISIKPNLMLMEGRGKILFPLYANYISKKGTSGSLERKTRVRIFGIVLPAAILMLSPVITIVSRIAPLFFPSRIKKEIAYHSRNTLR